MNKPHIARLVTCRNKILWGIWITKNAKDWGLEPATTGKTPERAYNQYIIYCRRGR